MADARVWNNTDALVVAADVAHAVAVLTAAGIPDTGKPWRSLPDGQALTLHGAGVLDLTRKPCSAWAAAGGARVLARFRTLPRPAWYAV